LKALEGQTFIDFDIVLVDNCSSDYSVREIRKFVEKRRLTNRIRIVPFVVLVRCFPEFISGMITEFIYFAMKHKRLRLYLKAKGDAIRMLPEMVKKRAMIMKNRKVSHRYLVNMMTPVWQKDFLMTKMKKFLHP
jgi:hypothetical protein